ncbi:unnamed protein product [Adineta steineri]|uniref:Uncharacterized protein n=1 Tax=Adineta steineri TaxID=433720 RepID=A0A814FXZ5_9BILA|nr:unnamed protein product [Adineta steineri]CAF4191085.1 unnamed protein product [Adineta steineri]
MFHLSAVGQLSQRTIDEYLSQLNVTAYIETQIVPLNVLDNIIQTTMKEFHLKASKSFGTIACTLGKSVQSQTSLSLRI